MKLAVLLVSVAILGSCGSAASAQAPAVQDDRYEGTWRLAEHVGAPGISNGDAIVAAQRAVGGTITIGEGRMVDEQGRACEIVYAGDFLLAEFEGGSFGGSWRDIGIGGGEPSSVGIHYPVYWIDAYCDGATTTAADYFAAAGEFDEEDASRVLEHRTIYFANEGALPLYGLSGQWIRMERAD